LIGDFRVKLNNLDKELTGKTCAYIIQHYPEHKNLYVAVECSDILVYHEIYQYLVLLKELVQQAGYRTEDITLKRQLSMNIELLEIAANTDIDFLKCTCQVYSGYSAHPESCKNIKIISKNDPSGGYLDMEEIFARCTRCGTPWKIVIEAFSATGYHIQWSYPTDDELS